LFSREYAVFDAIVKAKQLGTMVVERAGDYLELVRIELEIQLHDVKARMVSLIVTVLSAVLALIFLCLAVVVTYWDTQYRVMAAWGIVAFYALLAGIGYLTNRSHAHPESAFKTLHHELQEDIKLTKEIL